MEETTMSGLTTPRDDRLTRMNSEPPDQTNQTDDRELEVFGLCPLGRDDDADSLFAREVVAASESNPESTDSTHRHTPLM
jgi:hypothetical protein